MTGPISRRGSTPADWGPVLVGGRPRRVRGAFARFVAWPHPRRDRAVLGTGPGTGGSRRNGAPVPALTPGGFAPAALWGPSQVGGRRLRGLRRLAAVGSTGLVALVVALSVMTFTLIRVAESNLTRLRLDALAVPEEGAPLNLLVVGSDSRGDLSEEDIVRYTLGEVGGQRSDTVMLVSVTPDRQGASLVSFPRDLLVVDRQGTTRKLTEVFAGGPDGLVAVAQNHLGVPVHHFAEISIPGFIAVVDALSGAEICLDRPLVDANSGANFTAGCHDFGPREALAYVRSRSGARGDFERIERQQTFMRAMLDRMVETRTLVDVPRLFRVVERVAKNVTTDEDLGLSRMRSLAEELRGLADGSIPMTFVPGYPQTVGGKSYVLAYRPGAAELFRRLRAGEVLPARGSRGDRAGVHVTVWSATRPDAADVIASTLRWSGFQVGGGTAGPVDPGATTTVYATDVDAPAAGWIAATLGAPIEPLPRGASLPEGSVVAVAAGEDARPPANPATSLNQTTAVPVDATEETT